MELGLAFQPRILSSPCRVAFPPPAPDSRDTMGGGEAGGGGGEGGLVHVRNPLQPPKP